MRTQKTSLRYLLLYLLPKNCISKLLGKLVSMRLPKSLARCVNRAFASIFAIDLTEAELPIDAYPTLQEFFIRRLKPGLRCVNTDEKILVSPCDGFLSVADSIERDTLMQVKGKYYSLTDLLITKNLAERFVNGHYATLYLSPKDYHRFHSPVDGEIIETWYIPGALWPVNKWAVATIDQLFCQNERVITIIRERHTQKLLAHVAVGATVVGKIALAYNDFDQYAKGDGAMRAVYHEVLPIKKGEELGRFMFGSTVVLVMEPGLMVSFAKVSQTDMKMGETLGNLQLERKA